MRNIRRSGVHEIVTSRSWLLRARSSCEFVVKEGGLAIGSDSDKQDGDEGVEARVGSGFCPKSK